jgi:hypothetical protein
MHMMGENVGVGLAYVSLVERHEGSRSWNNDNGVEIPGRDEVLEI